MFILSLADIFVLDKYFYSNVLKSVGFCVLITLSHKGFHIFMSNRNIATMNILFIIYSSAQLLPVLLPNVQ
jgi:hypothetical protein